MNIPERSIDLWRQRLATHTADKPYRGRALQKFPEDLRIYQTIIEEARPEVIVEIGTRDGGSALWFADQLRCLVGGGHVVTVDIDPVRPLDDPDITMVNGDATDPEVGKKVYALVADRSAMVVEDSAHTYQVTTSVLQAYSGLVAPGQWLVVEDGVVDIEELRLPGWPRGVTPAIENFLGTAQGEGFARHRMDQYILTCHPGGWLRRER